MMSRWKVDIASPKLCSSEAPLLVFSVMAPPPVREPGCRYRSLTETAFQAERMCRSAVGALDVVLRDIAL